MWQIWKDLCQYAKKNIKPTFHQKKLIFCVLNTKMFHHRGYFMSKFNYVSSQSPKSGTWKLENVTGKKSIYFSGPSRIALRITGKITLVQHCPAKYRYSTLEFPSESCISVLTHIIDSVLNKNWFRSWNGFRHSESGCCNCLRVFFTQVLPGKHNRLWRLTEVN